MPLAVAMEVTQVLQTVSVVALVDPADTTLVWGQLVLLTLARTRIVVVTLQVTILLVVVVLGVTQALVLVALGLTFLCGLGRPLRPPISVAVVLVLVRLVWVLLVLVVARRTLVVARMELLVAVLGILGLFMLGAPSNGNCFCFVE